MRLGLITTSYPRSASDHAGSFVRGFARELVALGHTVEVIAPADSGSSARDRLRDPDIAVVRVPYLPGPLRRTFYRAGAPENLLASSARDPWPWVGARSFPAMASALVGARARRWDAIVAHWALPSTLIAHLAAPWLPRISVWHSGDAHLAEALRARAPRLPLDRALRSEVHWFVSSDTAARAALRSPHHRIVAPMAAERPRPYVRARQELAIADSELVLLALGRLVPIKGLDVLLEALPRDVTLLVAGAGPERHRLESIAHGRDRRVRFLGHVSGPAKDRAFAAADAFVLPSRPTRGRVEGAPVALAEAQLAGLPIIASDVGGVSGTLGELLVPPGDVPALRHAIARLRDPAERARLGAESRARGTQRTWGALRPRIEEALEAALPPARRRP